jgi:hypothetical protein
MEFIHTIKSLHAGPEDILVSFNVVALFTKVPTGEALCLLSCHSNEDTLMLFCHVLTFSFFSFYGQFYEQTDGVAVGLPLSLVIAKFFMEHFEEMALEGVNQKPICWLRYVDDMFVIWPHGPGKLSDFLDHLNSVHENIQFTMEMERNGHLPFLDIDMYRKPDGSLGHKVYCKPTHSNLYLNSNSHHHPSNKQAILSMLVHRARSLCDRESLHDELEFLRATFRHNGYSNWHLVTVTFLPFISMTFNCVSSLLPRHNIKPVGLPPKEDSQFPSACEG